MRLLNRTRFMTAVLALSFASMLAIPALATAAQPSVDLGTTSTFAVLAGQTITNTGSTTITGDAGGDLGVSPGSAFTGAAGVNTNGTIHLGDAQALQAQNDLVTAYDDAAGRTPVTRIPTELGGRVLKPGVYDSASGTFQITGTLTLDAEGDPDGVFVFLTDTTLITAANSRVNLRNSARYCRTFWQVGSSATLGTTSHFVGHIFALTSITVRSGASVQGQLLARNGAVTLSGNNITNGLCIAAQGAAINIDKSAAPTALTSGPGEVVYTYEVSTPGTATLSDLVVTDDKLDTVTYVSGDANDDGLLQPGETWIYTSTTTLTATTTNTGTATALGNGVTVIDTSLATVNVSDTGTINGGQIPDTATPWYTVLFVGFLLTLAGAVAMWRATRKVRDQS